MHRTLKILPPIAVIVVALASFAMSYVALRDVAAEVGAVAPAMAWLVPIVIDGGTIGGSAVIWSQAADGRRRQRFPFVFVGVMVIVSVIVNIAHADTTPLAQTIAALPPLVLLGTLELAAGQLKRAREIAAEQDAAEQDAVTQQLTAELAAQRNAHTQALTQMRHELDQAAADHELELTALADDAQHDASRAADAEAELAQANQRVVELQQRLHAASRTSRSDQPQPAAPTRMDPPAPSARPGQPATSAPDSPILAQALDAIEGDTDAAVRDQIERVFEAFVDLGGDPLERTLASDLAMALDSTPGYVRNVLRDRRNATT